MWLKTFLKYLYRLFHVTTDTPWKFFLKDSKNAGLSPLVMINFVIHRSFTLIIHFHPIYVLVCVCPEGLL